MKLIITRRSLDESIRFINISNRARSNMPMSEESALNQITSFLGENSHKHLINSLTLHRGWHRYDGDPTSKFRPIENSRQAYRDAVAIGST